MILVVGQRIEVWLAGWDQWIGGLVESSGFLDGVPCVRVRLDDFEGLSIFRMDQIRMMAGLFA